MAEETLCEVLDKAERLILRDLVDAVRGERRADISMRARDLDTIYRLKWRTRCPEVT